MSLISMFGKLVKAAIPFVLELGKKLFEKLGEAPALNEKTTVVDVEQIGNALHDLRAEVLERSQSAIDKANDALKFYVDEQLFGIAERAELLAKYEISSRSIERRMNELQERLTDFRTEYLNRRISLDNEQCRLILSLPSGAKKEAEFEQFINVVIDGMLEEYSARVRAELGKLYDEFESEIVGRLARLEKTVGEYEELVQSLDNRDEDRLEQLIMRSEIQIAACEAVLRKVEED